MATSIPNSFLGRLAGDTAQISTAINFATDTFKLMLLDSNHTTDIDAQVFIDDVSANEVAASGDYTTGGVALTLTGSTDDTNDLGKLDAVDISLDTVTTSAAYAVVYKDTGTPSTSPIIGIYDCVVTSTLGTLSITINASGLLTIAQA